MADYQIKITAVDNATPIVDKAFKKTQSSATSVSGKIGDRFRDVFENVTQNATGAFGSVAGGLFKLPGPAGIAAASILAIGGAAVAAAKKYAEANAANDTASAQFLANLEGLKKGFGDVVNSVGSSVIPVFNSLAEAFGFAGTKADELDAKRKTLFDGLKSQREQINAVIENLTLQRESQGAFKPVVDAANELKRVDSERKNILNQISTTEKAIQDARDEAFKKYGLAFLLDKEIRKEFERQLAVQNLSISPLNTQLESLNAQVLAAEELLLKEKALFDQRNAKPTEPKKVGVAEKIILQQRQLFKESGDFLTLFSDVQPKLIEGKKEEVQYSVALSDYAQAYLDKLRQQEAAVRAVGFALQTAILDRIEQAIFDGGKLKDLFKSLVDSALRIGFRALTGNIFGFENGGILGKIPQAASGMMVNRDSLIRVGEKNLPEVIIPLAPSKAPQRQKLMQEAGLANNGVNITFAPTIYANQADRNFARDLAQVFNAEVKKGLRLQTTQRSNRA